MSILQSNSSTSASEIFAARQVEFVAFLHRLPFGLDAFELGHLPGVREDCEYQTDQYQNLTLPVGMLDNDFRSPDLERFVDHFFEVETVSELVSPSFSFSENMFDAVVIPVRFVAESQAISVTPRFEPRRAIDEKDRIVDAMFSRSPATNIAEIAVVLAENSRTCSR